MKNNIIIAAFSMCLCVLSYFMGYESGYVEGTNEIGAVAIEALHEVRSSIIETNHAIGMPKVNTSDTVSVCAVYHPDGKQCVSDGHGGFLPHD